jgi:hypothetical protein
LLFPTTYRHHRPKGGNPNVAGILVIVLIGADYAIAGDRS